MSAAGGKHPLESAGIRWDERTAGAAAIRDVATADMQSIVDDLERARLELFGVESDAAAAFTEGSIDVLGSEVARSPRRQP